MASKTNNNSRITLLVKHLSPNATAAQPQQQNQQPRKIGTTEEGAAMARSVGGSASADDDDPYAIEATFVDLDKFGIPLVGTDADLAEDYIAGLNLMASRCDPKLKMGYVDTVEAGHVLLCVHPKSVTKVLTTSVQHFLGGLRPPSAAFFGPKVLFILEGREWLDLRNVLKRAFQKHNVNMMATDTYEAADKFKVILDRYAESGQDLDVMRAMACYHIQAIGKVCFHADMGVLDAFEDGPGAIEQSFEYLLEELPRRAYAADVDVQNDFESDTPDNRMMAEMSYQARNIFRNIIADRIDQTSRGEQVPNDLLEAMMDVFVEQYPEAKGNVDLLTQELGDNLIEITFAGFNTVTPTTSHAIFFLASNPDAQERVIEELDRVLHGRKITQEDLPKLVFTEHCIMETLRLCPPASLISRQTTRDLVLEGVTVPRATRVWMPACFIHRDPDVWGPDADAFVPDRWAESKPPRGAFIPFADGARNCAGRNMAMWEMTLALVTTFQNFRARPAPDFEWKTIFTGFGLRPFDFTEARVCMRLVFTKRDDAPQAV